MTMSETGLETVATAAGQYPVHQVSVEWLREVWRRRRCLCSADTTGTALNTPCGAVPHWGGVTGLFLGQTSVLPQNTGFWSTRQREGLLPAPVTNQEWLQYPDFFSLFFWTWQSLADLLGNKFWDSESMLNRIYIPRLYKIAKSIMFSTSIQS